jgi:tetratricopeptide (TPR) repeat protein
LQATAIAETLFNQESAVLSGRFVYFIQLLGQTFVNLGNTQKASELLHKALTFAEHGHYTQIYAKTLMGLAEIHRQQSNFAQALQFHAAAIAQLDQLGAKCDLAEAHFQQSLTYTASGNPPASQTSRDRAIQLFTTIQAPKQIAKVITSHTK